MGFRIVEHTGEIDNVLTGLEYKLKARKIDIDIERNVIKVDYDKIYLDTNGDTFKVVPMSYTVTEEEKINAWDLEVGASFEAAILEQMKIRNGIDV